MMAVLLGVPMTFRSGFLRAKKRFGIVSMVGIIAAVSDLVISVVFVLAGWGTTGAIAALVVTQLIAFLCAAHYARRLGFTESLRSGMFRLPDFKLVLPELKYAALVLVGSLAITALYSIDSVAVKHYFDAATAGQYAGISTVGRIIFFLTATDCRRAVAVHQNAPGPHPKQADAAQIVRADVRHRRRGPVSFFIVAGASGAYPHGQGLPAGRRSAAALKPVDVYGFHVEPFHHVSYRTAPLLGDGYSYYRDDRHVRAAGHAPPNRPVGHRQPAARQPARCLSYWATWLGIHKFTAKQKVKHEE